MLLDLRSYSWPYLHYYYMAMLETSKHAKSFLGPLFTFQSGVPGDYALELLELVEQVVVRAVSVEVGDGGLPVVEAEDGGPVLLPLGDRRVRVVVAAVADALEVILDFGLSTARALKTVCVGCGLMRYVHVGIK